MAYSKTNWQNLPNQTTPINATNLNKIEQGIYDATYVNGVNVGNSVNSDYRVNVLHSKNKYVNPTTITVNAGGDLSTSTATYINSNSFSINVKKTGTSSNSVFCEISLDRSLFKTNTTYTLSRNFAVSGVQFSSAGAIRTHIDSNYGTTSTNDSITFTTPSSFNSISMLFYGCVNASQQGEATVTITNIQVEEGSTATSYEPYVTPSINVDGEEIYSKQKVEEAKINTRYNCYTRKIGNMVQLTVHFSSSSNPVDISGYTTISLGTVPNNCRPSAELSGPCYVRHSSGGSNVVYFAVDTTGSVRLFNWGTALTGVENISSIITYIVN